eukprot:s301_g26.t1
MLTQDAINAVGAMIAAMLNVFQAAPIDLEVSSFGLEVARCGLMALEWPTSQALFLAGALGFAGGFGILHQNLENYSWYWLLSAGLNVVLFVAIFCLVAETKHLANSPSQGVDLEIESETSTDQEFGDWEDPVLVLAQAGRGALRDLLRFLCNLRHDPVLLQLLILTFVLKAVWAMEHLARYMLITYLNYSQAAASMVGFASSINGCVGSRINTMLLPRLGPWTTLFLALCMGIVGTALEGVAVVIAENEMSLLPSLIFWTGKVRVEKDQQGRLFSIMQLMDLVGHTLGMSVLFRKLYNSSWTGWMAPLSSFVGIDLWASAQIPSTDALQWLDAVRASGERSKCGLDFDLLSRRIIDQKDIAIRLIHSFGDLTSAFNLLPKAAATLAIWKARYPQKHKHPLNCNM